MVFSGYENFFKHFFSFLLIASISGLFSIEPVKSQSTSQVTITGVPSILPSPFADDIERDFTSGQYPITFNYTSQANQPVDFTFLITVRKDNRTIIEIESEPESFSPGSYSFHNIFEQLFFPKSYGEVLQDLPREIRNQVIQSGVVPEGRYSIEIIAQPVAQRQMTVIPGEASFSIQYPPPPLLVSPSNQSNLTLEVPTFAWTPVVSTRGRVIEYDFLLVELFEGQTPLQAIEANRAIAEETLVGTTTLPYTFEFLPLEPGSRYAWQVTARDGAGEMPLQSDGESEIYTFTYQEPEEEPVVELDELQEIELIPEVLKLTNLHELEDWQIEDIGELYELNGQATVEFNISYSREPIQAEAEIRGLTIQKSSLQNPVITSGGVDMLVSDISDQLLPGNDLFDLLEFEYRFGEPLIGTVSFDDPDFGSFEARGEMALTQFGPEGEISVAAEDIFTFETNQFALTSNEIKFRLPQQDVIASADVKYLGESTLCSVDQMNLAQNEWVLGLNCENIISYDLSGGREMLEYTISQLRGSLAFDRADQQLDYDVDVNGHIGFDFMNTEPCGFRIQSSLSSEESSEHNVIQNSCTIPDPKLSLGFARLNFSDFKIDELQYNSESGDWTFDFPFEAALTFPVFNQWSYQPEESFRFTNDGIEIPSFSLSENLPQYTHDDLDMVMNYLNLEGFEFPWFEWDESDPGDWNLQFSGEASIAETHGLPFCLAGSVLSIDNGQVTSGHLSADLELYTLTECSISLIAGHKVILSALGGSIYSEYGMDADGHYVASSATDLFIEGRYEAGSPLSCADGTESGQDVTAEIAFVNGLIEGEFGIQESTCQIPIALFDATLNEAALNLWGEEGEQQAEIESSATLHLSQNNQVDGSFVYNVMDLRFTEIDFLIDEPFIWDIPSDDPVLSFGINEARLDLEGFHIDGRNELLIGDETIGTTFDEVVKDLKERRITSGQVFFDQSFAMTVSFDDGWGSPSFLAVPLSEDEETVPDAPENGLIMELGAGVGMDRNGIFTSGDARGKITVDELDFGQIGIEFTDDFSFQLKPFNVGTGRADFYYNNSRIAYLDNSGFHPLISGLAEEIIPDKLPAPSTNIAYIKLRDDEGELLVDFEEPEPGLIELQTRPGTPIELVLPVLDDANPPAVAGVEFQDFVITATPGNFNVDDGSASVTIDDDLLSDLQSQIGLPFTLEEIIYGKSDQLADDGKYLQLFGDLKLFGERISSEANTMLQISSGGLLSGEIQLSDISAYIPMVGQSEHLQLEVNDVQGALAMSLFDDQGIGYDLDIGSQLWFGVAGNQPKSLSSFDLNIQPGSFIMNDFSGLTPDEPVRVELPRFTMNLNSVNSIPNFSYDQDEGWDFMIDLDADFEFNIAGENRFTLPMNGLQLGTNGFAIPVQEINDGTLDGKQLPSFDLQGFEFQPLALRILEPVEYDWFSGEIPDINPLLDFSVFLPEFSFADITPPDGFTFTNVTIQEGILSGEMSTFEPIGGIQIPLGPSGYEPPEFQVDEIMGSLGAYELEEEIRQHVDLSLAGSIENIPFFEDPDPDCETDVQYSLDIAEGRGFYGTLEDLTPCGSVTMGPVTLSAGTGNLYLNYDEEQQEVLFDGTLIADLQGPENDVTAQGNIELDLIAGQITDGQINIDQPFLMNLPAIGSSFMNFEVNEAEISSHGFLLDADGYLEAGQTDIFVSFNQFLFALPDFGIESGYAELSSGFGLQIGLSPLTVSSTDADIGQPPANDAVNMIADGSVIVDSDGLNFEGEAGASLRIAGQEMASLHVLFEDGFTHSVSSPAVNEGRAEIYSDEEQENLLAVYDSDGFDFIDALIAQLPDTLGLPSSDIAYAIIKDQEGEPVIDVESNQQGGYTLSTNDEPLSIHFPALEDDVQGEPYVDAYFTLTTDDNYVPNGGEITMVSPMSLEPSLDVPVSLDSLAIDGEDNLLTTVISVDLPGAFGDITASAETTIGTSGFEEAEINIGNYTDSYQEDLDTIVQRDIIAQLSGDTSDSEFILGLYGAKLSINSPAEFVLSGIAETSLLETNDGNHYPIFYTAGYSDGWQFDVNVPEIHESADLGLGRFNFDEESPVDISVDDDQFIVEISGHVSFEEMLGESLIFSVKDMLLGAENLQDSPQLVFGLGEATAGIEGTQVFDFFEGNLTGSFTDAEIFIDGRVFGASVANGDLTFLERSMGFEDLSVDTGGNFEIGGVTGDEVQIIGEYLVLESVGLNRDEEEGISVSSSFFFMLPEPVDESGSLDVILGRDGIDGSVFVESEIPEHSDFNPEEVDEINIELGSHVTVTLTDILFDVDPKNISDSHIATAGTLSIFGKERIYLGESGNVKQNPGISVKNRLGLSPVQYNITGNGYFEFDHSFFSIEIDADVASSNEELFEIELSGSVASTEIPGIDEAEGNFGGMIINTNGIDEIGNITGGVTLKFWEGIASLELGSFEHKSEDEPFSQEIPGGFDRDLNDLQNGENGDETQTKDLLRYLCFGPCRDGNDDDNDNNDDDSALTISLGGQSGEGGGGFGGGIGQVLFYETEDGKISFTATNLSLELKDYAQASANLLFESSTDGSQLFAAGFVEISKGGQDVSAAIAGGFSTMGDDLSFGVFAAVTTSQELPIIPGVLGISGFGGGFFYRPVDDQLNMVYAVVDDVRGEPADGIDRTITAGNRPSDQLNLEEDVELRFSVMLFAELHVASILDGTTFFEITDSYIALDGDGIVMGMDSSPTMAGGFFLGASYSDNMNIQATFQAIVEFDPVITAEAAVQFFAGYTGSGQSQTLEWGLIGEIDVELFRGLISGGSSTIMASNDGFLLEVEMEAGIDRSALTLKGYLNGSIWNLRYDGAEIPFGAYGIAGGEIDILSGLVSGEAAIKVAFVRKATSRYELFGHGQYAASALFGAVSSDGEAWIKIMTHPIEVDAGRGEPDFDDNTIAQAQEQANEFEQMIQDAMDGLAGELGMAVMPGLNLGDDDIAQAGYNFWTSEYHDIWKHLLLSNEDRFVDEYLYFPDPSADYAYDLFLEVDEDVQGFLFRESELESNSQTSWTGAEEELEEQIEDMDLIIDQTMNRLDETVIRAIEYEYIASQLQEDITNIMASSPANIINQPTQKSLGEGNTPVFQVEDELAAQQSQTAADFSTALEEMEEQVYAVVDSIEHNIQELKSMMGAQFMPVITGMTPGEYTQFEVEYTETAPPINEVSEYYQQTLQSVDRYYSVLANKYWNNARIAIYARDKVDFWYDSIDEEIVQPSTSVLEEFSMHNTDGSFDYEENSELIDKHIEIMAERGRILEDLADGPGFGGMPYAFSGYQVETEVVQKLENAFQNQLPIDFSQLEEMTRNLLLDMHVLGLQEYLDQKIEFMTGDFIAEYQAYRENLIDIMVEHTVLIDDFYNLKANMYGSLYSIIDDYVEIRRAAQQQDTTSPVPGSMSLQELSSLLEGESEESELSVLDQYELRREEILQALQPPEIVDISVNSGILGGGARYFGWANIGWEISHPLEVVENSIILQEYAYASEASGETDQYVSVGLQDPVNYSDNLVHYTFLRGDQAECSLIVWDCDDSETANTRKVDLDLRARGLGGLTTRRQVTFEIPAAVGGQSTSPGDNILPEITNPPDDIMVDLDAYYNRTEDILTWRNYNPITQQMEIVQTPTYRYWTSDPANIQVKALAEETVSSIRGYEYAVGSSVGTSDIIDFTDLIGDREQFPDEPGNWTDMIEATTRILNMNPGDLHYLTVEAYNMGDLSIKEEVQIPVVYDDTPPTAPQPPDDLVLLPFTGTYNPFGNLPIEAEPFITLPPQYDVPYFEQLVRSITDLIPSLSTISWQPSEDNESGVSHYEYLITTDDGYSDTQFSQNGYTTEETSIDITSGESTHDGITFDFDDYMYVHIRAVNNAGHASEVYTHSQFPHDPNPPSNPEIAGFNGTDHIRIYLKERSYDAESGVEGYQYSIGTSPGGSDIRSWPEDGEIDHKEESILITGSAVAPYIEIPKDELPEGQELYFNVKAINNQGTESDVAVTGPVILDSNPPEEPVITLDVKENGNKLEIKVENIYDDVSGVAGVYATVLPDNFPYHLATPSWEDIGNIANVRHDNFSVTLTYDVPSEVSVYNLNVTVRVQNAAGLETSVTESVPAPFIPDIDPTTIQTFSF